MSARRGFWHLTIVLSLLIQPSAAWPQKRQVPAPQRTFTIFFGWNSATIPSRYKDVVAQAALNAKNLMDLRGWVEVRGYVDTSMSEQRSVTLSENMGKAVCDELIRDGLDPNRVTYSGQGKTQLLKQTPDGVREPINRRVEIRIQ
jgi:OmpA-OmpF porin, OOP family